LQYHGDVLMNEILFFYLQTWMYIRMYENLFLIDFFSMWYEWTHNHISLIFFSKS